MRNKSALTVLLFCLTTLQAEATQKKTYQSCSVLASEVFTGIQLYSKGIDLTTLYQTLPDISEKAKQRLKSLYANIEKNGLIETYSKANSQYSQCSKSAFDSFGKPSKTSIDYLFYMCSGENKLRYEIILAIYLGGTKEQVIPQVHAGRRELALYLYDIVEKSKIEGAFDFSATELKRCLNQ